MDSGILSKYIFLNKNKTSNILDLKLRTIHTIHSYTIAANLVYFCLKKKYIYGV